MNRTLGYAGCGGLLMAVVVFTTARHVTPAVVAAAEPAPSPTPLDLFNDNWSSAAIPLAFKNAELARIFSAAIGQPRSREDLETVKTSVPVEVAAARNDVPQTVAATVSAGRHPRNVCEKHGMRKVKHGRYGWRCRR